MCLRSRINKTNQLTYLQISTPVLPGSALIREELAVINFNTLLLFHSLLLTVIKTIHKTRIPWVLNLNMSCIHLSSRFLHPRKCYYEIRLDKSVPILCAE